jgi:hypothetical protein
MNSVVENWDPPAPDYDENGVDRTLIRACLKDTPLECLQALEEMHQLAESVTRVGQSIPPTD